MKIIFLTLLTLLTLNSAIATADLTNSVELRSSAYFHRSSTFEEVYGKVGPSFGLEATNKFFCFDLFTNLDYFSKHSPRHDYGRSKIELFNGSLGLRYSIDLSSFLKPYIGIGPSVTCINLKQEMDDCHYKSTKIGFGVVAKSGVIIEIGSFYYVNIFADYHYLPARWNKCIDVGGLKTGLGLGINF